MKPDRSSRFISSVSQLETTRLASAVKIHVKMNPTTIIRCKKVRNRGDKLTAIIAHIKYHVLMDSTDSSFS